MKRAVVTGGAGFIGSHLVDALLLAGWHVTVLDSFDDFYPREIKVRNLAGALLSPRCVLVEADIRDKAALAPAFQETVDVIIHLAAKAGVRPSIAAPLLYQEVNVLGTQNLLDMAVARNVRKFVFASSSSVYGVNPNCPWREDDHVLMPISPYAATKVAGELIGHVYSHLHGVSFTALRFFTAYGPRQRPDLAIAKLAGLMRKGHPVPVFGDGTTARDYTFVADIIQGVLSAISYDKSMFEVINLGNSHTVPLIEMIRTLEVALGVKADLQFEAEQPGDVPRTWSCIEKAARLLDYRPQTTFVEGVASYVSWLRSMDSGRSA